VSASCHQIRRIVAAAVGLALDMVECDIAWGNTMQVGTTVHATERISQVDCEPKIFSQADTLVFYFSVFVSRVHRFSPVRFRLTLFYRPL
jgi:hypothetical protein